QQMNFMMAYECFVMWALKRGIEGIVTQREADSAIVAMQQHLAKHAWYRPEAFEKVWESMQETMPMGLRPTVDGLIYPAAEMLMAARLAGFPYPLILDLDFGAHIVTR